MTPSQRLCQATLPPDLSFLLMEYMTLPIGISVRDAVHRTLSFLRDRLGVPHASIALLESDSFAFRIYDVRGIEDSNISAGELIPVVATVLSAVVQRAEPLYRPDIAAANGQYAVDTALLRAGLRSDFLIPLWSDGQCLGALNAASDRVDGFTEPLKVFLRLIAPSLAQSLRNILLIESQQRTEQRYLSLLDNIHDMVQSVDRDGGFLYVNRAWLDTLGYQQEELHTLTLWDIIDPRCMTHCQEVFARIMAGETVDHLETSWLRKDGATITVEGSISTQQQGSQIIATQGVFRDISERVEAEKALQASERRFRTSIEQSPLSVQILNSRGYTVRVNRAWETLWGTTLDAVANFCILEDQQLRDKGIMPYIEAAFAGTAAELPPIVYDPSPNVTAPGPRNDRWVRAFIYPVKDDAGQVQEVFLMHEDVTKRIEAEKTARVLEKISKICLQAQTQDHLLSKILEQLLVEFDCERAWLLFPCDPTTPSWRIPYEAARPGWPGANASGEEFPLNPVIAEMFEQCLHSDNALTLETGEVPVDDDDLQKTYTILSQMHMALKPKFGQPWALGLHYCAKRHRFSAHERQLFTEIGHRVAETLGTLLTLRNLAESQSSLSEAQRIAKLGNWELDPLTHELKWSDETYRIFGLTKTQFDVSYKAFLEACHPDDVALVTKTYEESLRDRTTYDLIHRVTTPEGSTKYVHERGETRYDAQGNALKTVGTVQDVTARVLAEEKLRLSSVVVENTGEAIMITDTRHKIVSVNRAFENITGYQTTEVLGKNPNMLIKSDYHDAAFFNALSQQVRATGTWQGEIWNRRNNGEAFPAWSTVTAVRDAMGNATNYVTVFSDISSIKQSQARLDYLAYHDPLTALPNRLLLNDRIEHALQRAAREERQVGVLFLDLDHFKTINDSLGHPVGDRLLKQVARRIKGLVREEDTVSRLGGDEFIILLEDVDDTRTLGKLAQKIIESFREPFSIEPHELQLGVSVGISVYPRDGSDGATLIKNADAAMYRAKEEGRNDYQFYTTELTTAAFERLTLETALRQALKREELVLHYQPQYALATGKLLGAEALIRWRHEELGLISPDKFISVAEESGLISSIGEWVLHHACVQLRHWHAAGLPIGTIAVNVSGKQFQRGRFADVVKSALDASGLAAHHLELELTESAIMQEAERGVNVLHELNDLGVTIAIDDFGTGYSSLSYLKNLPVHKLKIDRSFVRDIPQDANDEAITRAVIALGHSLQLAVLAEGVETKEQQAFLKTQGCHEAQGFLYSKPIGAGDFPALLH